MVTIQKGILCNVAQASGGAHLKDTNCHPAATDPHGQAGCSSLSHQSQKREGAVQVISLDFHERT